MSSVERVVEQSLLYDYYGELLNSHQRKIYEAAVFEDLSLGEIAGEYGISRQGVYDLLKRCDAKLKQYEDSLHLMEKQGRQRELAEAIEEVVGELRQLCLAGSLTSEDISEPSVVEVLPGSELEEKPVGETDRRVLRQSLDRLQQLTHQLLEEI